MSAIAPKIKPFSLLHFQSVFHLSCVRCKKPTTKAKSAPVCFGTSRSPDNIPATFCIECDGETFNEFGMSTQQ